MKPYHLGVPLALVVVAVAIDASVPITTADPTCPQTKAVFYTTDTQVLARTLAASASDCADYDVSISPTTAAPAPGEPRGGVALAAVHAQGRGSTLWRSCDRSNGRRTRRSMAGTRRE
jgi:hypothetical protein